MVNIICSGSLFQFYISSQCIKVNKTSLTYSIWYSYFIRKLVFKNFVKDAAESTLFTGEEELGVVGQILGQVQLDVLLGEQRSVPLSLLLPHILADIRLVLILLLEDPVLQGGDVPLALLLQDALGDGDLEDGLVALRVGDSSDLLRLLLDLLRLLLLGGHQLLRPLHLHLQP